MDWTAIGKQCVNASMQALRELKAVRALNDGQNIQTNADVVSHEAIEKTLVESGISCSLVSEEKENPIPVNGGSGETFVFIDPIDNTAFYLRGELCFCGVGMIVYFDNRPQYSFVGEISTGFIYHCDETSAYKDGKKIVIPEKVQGKNIITGYAPYKLRAERFFGGLVGLTERDYLVYNFGGMLLAAKLAEGRYDAQLEVKAVSLHEMAGAIIAERAGGILTTLLGKPVEWKIGKKQTMLVSRNRKIHQEILEQFKNADYEE